MKTSIKIIALLAFISSFGFAGELCDFKADRLRDKIQNAQEKNENERVEELNLALDKILKYCDDKKIIPKQEEVIKERQKELEKLQKELKKVQKEEQNEKMQKIEAKLEEKIAKQSKQLNEEIVELEQFKALVK